MDGDYTLITTINDPGKTNASHKPEMGIAGCYYVTAIDFSGNESEPGNIYCVMNCPDYQLPNTFTPNNDGSNELFIPLSARFIDRIECKIFNRWGGLVFETSDPQINWNGKNFAGKDLSDGTYYYTCKIFNVSFNSESSEQILTGFIQLIR